MIGAENLLSQRDLLIQELLCLVQTAGNEKLVCVLVVNATSTSEARNNTTTMSEFGKNSRRAPQTHSSRIAL